jgi:NAD(P)-dependent dehydrogenase (short-subunit alcohol dehydrogenase family)
MASYLITGCSRGLGLSIIATLAKKPASEVRVVFASARSTSRALEEVVSSSPGRVIFVQLDITDEECVKEAARQVEKMLEDKGLDILINNAGVLNTTPGGIETMYVSNKQTPRSLQ